MNHAVLFRRGVVILLLLDAVGVTLSLTAGAFLIAVVLGVPAFFVVWALLSMR